MFCWCVPQHCWRPWMSNRSSRYPVQGVYSRPTINGSGLSWQQNWGPALLIKSVLLFGCILSRHYPCICHWVAELLVSAYCFHYLPEYSSLLKARAGWYAGAETLGDGFFASSLWRIPKRLNQVLLLRAIICAESMCGGAFLPPPPGLSSCYQEYLRHGNTIGVIN